MESSIHYDVLNMNYIRPIMKFWRELIRRLKPGELVFLYLLLLFIIILYFIIIIFAFHWLFSNFTAPIKNITEVNTRVKYLEQYIEFIRITVVGVILILISSIISTIPHIISQARDTFQQYKESRKAYSRAKTAVLYLPDKVVNADNRKQAFLLVEKAHKELHFAETFKEMIISQGYLEWFGNPKLWILYNYWQIVAVAKVLRRESKMDLTASETKEQLRENLNRTLEVVHQRFGKRGEKCKHQEWKIDLNSQDIYFKSKFTLGKWEFYKNRVTRKLFDNIKRDFNRFEEEDTLEKMIEEEIKQF